MKKDTRSRAWILTQSAELITLEDLKLALSDYTYIGQLEQGAEGGEQGYKHYQLYIENPTAIRFSTLKNKLPNAHIEPRNGTRQQAYDYVTKSETSIGEPFGNGEIDLREQQGKRSDLDNMLMLLEEGATPDEIFTAFPKTVFLHRRKVEEEYYRKLRAQYRKKRRDIQVTYIFGSTGTGKTSYVLDKYGDENVYIFSDYPAGYNDKEKFDDYNGEDIILFDEFRSGIPLSRMLRYLDRYYCDLPARYANKIAVYTKVYIATNWVLEKQYSHIREQYPEDWNAFLRRIHRVYNFNVSKTKPIYPTVQVEQTAFIDRSKPIEDDGLLPF